MDAIMWIQDNLTCYASPPSPVPGKKRSTGEQWTSSGMNNGNATGSNPSSATNAANHQTSSQATSPKNIREKNSGTFQKPLPPRKTQFLRYWFHSHHIYSKLKRQNIVHLAGELGLTGFSLSGKPGFICVEGPASDVKHFWETIRGWAWKRLTLVHQESVEGHRDEPGPPPNWLHFGPFKEQNFSGRKVGYNGWHMDMGQFGRYLTEHGSGDIFRLLIGLESEVQSNSNNNNAVQGRESESGTKK